MIIKGISEQNISKISELKHEPEWMKNFRLNSYKTFCELPQPSFGPELPIDFDEITYYR